ncbi:MAG: glycosyltransferase family 2 protein [Candidatus Zixiibacteriota bacterium]
MTPDISVQIPVRDGGKEFTETLESLRKQDTSYIRWELIIIDDGSHIPVEEEFDLSFSTNVCVKTIRLDGSGNRPAARNAGWNATDAPVVLFSDGDIRFESDIIQGHLKYHRDNPNSILMGARVNAWMDDATPWQKWFDTRGMGNRPSGEFPPKYFVTGNISIPLWLLKETGGFDEKIDKYGGEDTEFGFRASHSKISFYWNPSLRVYHLDHVTVREHSLKMMEYGSSGLKYTLEKVPEARGILGGDWIKPLSASPVSISMLLMRAITRIVLFPPLYRCILGWMEKAGKPAFLFTYLSVAACLIGLKGKSFKL